MDTETKRYKGERETDKQRGTEERDQEKHSVRNRERERFKGVREKQCERGRDLERPLIRDRLTILFTTSVLKPNLAQRV